LGEVLSPFLRRNLYASSIVLSINSTQEFTMSILSVLAFPTAFVRATKHFELIKVVVASKDAWQARKALLACPDTAIVRCLPRHKDNRVALEIRFPAGRGDAVIDRILSCLPYGEFGGVVACDSHSSMVYRHDF
jgi:hypothetical protein